MGDSARGRPDLAAGAEWLDRFDRPPPLFARRLLDAARAGGGRRPDLDEVRTAARALGVLRAQQRHAIGGLVEDLAALRRVLPSAAAAVTAVDDALAAAAAAYVEELTAILSAEATRDPLTGLPNRAAFGEALQHEVSASGRSRPPALLLVDLDGFKGVNDTDGHLAGDAVLVAVAALLRNHVRQGDLPCRLGGDEFAVLLPRTSRRQAAAVARRLLAAAQEDPGLSSAHARVSFSIGVGWLRRPQDPEAVIAAADGALYAVKAAGGNGVALGGGTGAAA